jgi:membrane protease subunit (stomatin/prohibitin family)
MGLGKFLHKQFIDVIEWTEPDDGTLAVRYPMEDREIQTGASLTVRESQMAAFVNEGRMADVFGPGRYTLRTETLPLLTNLMNWDKLFQSPFKSDVYFFSTRLQTAQKWGTANPITIRDKDFGIVRLRAFGTYTYRIVTPATFHEQLSGTREVYRVDDLEPQLRNLAVNAMTTAFAQSQVPFLDMAANQTELAGKIAEALKPSFTALGLSLEGFVVENLSLPDELQKRLDERIGMNIVGDLNKYTQYQVGQSIPLAAQNEGGAAGAGAGLAAGFAMAQQISNSVQQANSAPQANAAPQAATKFCQSCGKSIPHASKFCPECGTAQG